MSNLLINDGYLPTLDLSKTEHPDLVAYRQSFKERHRTAIWSVYVHHYEGRVFYVGAGSGCRAGRTTSFRSHPKGWRNIVRANGRPEVIILRSSLSKEEAALVEKQEIDRLRADRHELVNTLKGGEIPSWEAAFKGAVTLKKWRKQLTEARVWRQGVKFVDALKQAREAFPAIPMTQPSLF